MSSVPLQLTKHLSDLFWKRHIGLNQDTIGPAFADLGERLFRGSLVLEVVNRDFNATLREGESNPSPDAARTAGNQRVPSIKCHMSGVNVYTAVRVA